MTLDVEKALVQPACASRSVVLLWRRRTAVGRSVARSMVTVTRSYKVTLCYISFTPAGQTHDAWEPSRKRCSLYQGPGSVAAAFLSLYSGDSLTKKRALNIEPLHMWRLLSSTPSETLKHSASLTFKSGFLSVVLSGPKLISKVSFAANFSVLYLSCISVILLLSRN